MNRDVKFWVSTALFQLVFGLTVFAATRAYYMPDTVVVSASSSVAMGQPSSAWPEGSTGIDITRLGAFPAGGSTVQDPVEISRLAEGFFANRQYYKAAQMYARLLEFGPNNVETHNNLGLTLHYLGRSTEALGILKDGVALDPENQRIWLTLGYVNTQLGNTREARDALTRASQVGTDDAIRQSALQMLEKLP